ncbi:hypothetical protein [Modestobacter lacusdianchii]
MRDPHRGLASEPSDVPVGILLTADGHTSLLDFAVVPASPLRQQLRDATLPLFVDRGGELKSPGSGRMYLSAARLVGDRLAAHATNPPDAATLQVGHVHAALFGDLTTPVPVRTVLARRLLLNAALTAGNDALVRYLRNLTLFGYAKPSKPYSPAELACVIDWCKDRLSALFARRNAALRLLEVGPDASDEEALAAAQRILDVEPPPRDGDATVAARRWWSAWVLVHAFDERVAADRTGRAAAIKALFPDVQDALAATLLVINEYGAEGQVLASMDVTDVRRLPGRSSVMEIAGVKARADRAVSRRGNAVSTWSGGRVLERWIDVTAPARRWTGTEHVWLWRSKARDGRTSVKTVRLPVLTYVPSRPLVQEGHEGIEGPDGARIRLSTRRMRKSWAERSERALGPGVAGQLDPNHSRLSAWAMYRSAALSPDERQAVIAEAQDDLLGLVRSSQLVIDADLQRDEVLALLVDHGVEPATAERIVRGEGDDSGTVTCRDARQAPGQAVGTLCRQTPFACLLCENAIHTRHHLPVILALSDSIDAERRQMPAEQFVQRWGGVDVGVQHVLSRFSDRAKQDAAREIAEAQHRIERLKEVYT